ncbi:hypothetical protein EmuJ_000506700 [Echinococcus multilocularis]|uniref:Uncharacterized protein n=1 Tax=Echinococcus multilocularis TaxID=6211 RepID=A0A068Y6I3_ECHMU|nr:hypothetical protein EmuJ_000506700 [Echinococcus multilocularis]
MYLCACVSDYSLCLPALNVKRLLFLALNGVATVAAVQRTSGGHCSYFHHPPAFNDTSSVGAVKATATTVPSSLSQPATFLLLPFSSPPSLPSYQPFINPDVDMSISPPAFQCSREFGSVIHPPTSYASFSSTAF